MKENNNPAVNSQLLVAEGKSSRLTAIRNKTQGQKNKLNEKNSPSQLSSDLKPEQKQSLQLAIKIIEDKVDCILNSYPGGKRKTFFKLKYSVDVLQIRQLAIKDVFVILQLDSQKISHFRLIENLNSVGQNVQSNKG